MNVLVDVLDREDGVSCGGLSIEDVFLLPRAKGFDPNLGVDKIDFDDAGEQILGALISNGFSLLSFSSLSKKNVFFKI